VARTQKDKDRLSNLMAYGEDIAPPTSASLQAAREKMWRDQLAGLDDVEADRFEERMLSKFIGILHTLYLLAMLL